MVGLGRLELPTSRLSSARSNQLSYRPVSPNHRPEFYTGHLDHKETKLEGRDAKTAADSDVFFRIYKG
jgi:hypothetical protein